MHQFEHMHAEGVTVTRTRRPPAPKPPATRLGPLAFYRALRHNPITVWRAEAYEAPYIVDNSIVGSVVLLNEPELIRRVFIDNAANYPKDKLLLDKLTPAVGLGLLTADGESWRLQRRTVAPLFQRAAVASYLTPMAASINEMLARWEELARSGVEVDVAREVATLTYDIISRTVFSHEIETPAEVMGEAITSYFEALGRIDLWDIIPLPRFFPRPSLMKAKRSQQIFREEVRRMLARRRARVAAGATPPDDLVTRLIAARDPETGEPLSDTVIHDNLVTFIGAGHETTANGLAWTLFLLSQFPESDALVAAEASRIAEVPGDEDLTTLVETRKVLDESMRLYPPVPLLSRQAIGPDRLGDVEIKPRTRVIIAPWVLHRNRRLWRDPELFMPDRFAPENRAAIPRFAYLPFGAGTRVCVGMTFANHEMLLTVAMIMRRFRLTLAEGADIQPFARMTLRPMNGLPMRISAR